VDQIEKIWEWTPHYQTLEVSKFINTTIRKDPDLQKLRITKSP
jgi:hypothetical protein